MNATPQPTSGLVAGRLTTRTLLDRFGHLWQWDSDLLRHPGRPPGVFCHDSHIRTEQEIENYGEPIIEVSDPQVLVAKLEPVPAAAIQLNDFVVLPGMGELSPVIGVWPCSDLYVRRLYVCTDNGDWVRRAPTSPVLRADRGSPVCYPRGFRS